MAAQPITSDLPIAQAHTAPPKSALRRNRAYTALFAIRIIQILIGAVLLAYGIFLLAALPTLISASATLGHQQQYSSPANSSSDPAWAELSKGLGAELNASSGAVPAEGLGAAHEHDYEAELAALVEELRAELNASSSDEPWVQEMIEELEASLNSSSSAEPEEALDSAQLQGELDAQLGEALQAELARHQAAAFSVAIAVLAAMGGLVTSLGCLGVALPIAWLVYLARPERRAKAHTHARSAGADVAADAVLASIWLLLLVTSIILLAINGPTGSGLEAAGIALYAVCAGLYIASAALTNRLRAAGFFAAQLKEVEAAGCGGGAAAVHHGAGAPGLNSV